MFLAASLLTVTGCSAGRANSPVATAVPLPSPTGTHHEISQVNLGHLWPFTVERGAIACYQGEQTVFIAPDGHTYALNDAAAHVGFDSVDPIRARGSGGSQISLGALRSQALGLCSVRQE